MRSTPFASGLNEPVEVSISGSVVEPALTAAASVTGSIPRPEIAMSVALDVGISEALASTLRPAVVRTPPAV